MTGERNIFCSCSCVEDCGSVESVLNLAEFVSFCHIPYIFFEDELMLMMQLGSKVGHVINHRSHLYHYLKANAF